MTADDIDFSASSLIARPRSAARCCCFPDLTSQRFPSQPATTSTSATAARTCATALDAHRRGHDPARSRHRRAGVVRQRRSRRDAAACRSPARRGRMAQRQQRRATSVDWACGVDPLESRLRAAGHTIASADAGRHADRGQPAGHASTPRRSSTECGFASLTLPRIDEDDFDESLRGHDPRHASQDSLGNVGQARATSRCTTTRLLRRVPDRHRSLRRLGAAAARHGRRRLARDRLRHRRRPRARARRAAAASCPAGRRTTNAARARRLGLRSTRGTRQRLPSVGPGRRRHRRPRRRRRRRGRRRRHGRLRLRLPGATARRCRDSRSRSNPACSAAAIRNEANRLDYGVIAAPTLADLDVPATARSRSSSPRWTATCTCGTATARAHAGLPGARRRPRRVCRAVDPIEPPGHLEAQQRQSRRLDRHQAAQLAVGRRPRRRRRPRDRARLERRVRARRDRELLDSTTPRSALLATSLDLPNGRVYALSHLGTADPAVAANPSGPFLPGWPVKIGILTKDLLPTVGHGVNAAPVLADSDDDGDDEVFINGNNGPAYLLAGRRHLGLRRGLRQVQGLLGIAVGAQQSRGGQRRLPAHVRPARKRRGRGLLRQRPARFRASERRRAPACWTTRGRRCRDRAITS